jgi:peptidoglycan hydrolase-like protein with peptidoglycan-binding domain
MTRRRVFVMLWALLIAVVLTAPGASAQSPRTGGVEYAPPTSAVPAPAAPAALGTRIPLEQGMTGDDVVQLQQALTDAGYAVRADGDFGPATAQALRAWETATARVVDGIVDADDAAALLAVLDAGAPLVAPPLVPVAPTPTATPVPATPTTTTTGLLATINSAGHAVAAPGSPIRVQRIVAAANHIATLPYRYGGGHGSFLDTAYDCSGSVSYALHGASLLDRTLDSTDLETFGAAGAGRWVTIYANAGHTFMVLEGLRFDTSGATAAGTRWQSASASTHGYIVRHPVGL